MLRLHNQAIPSEVSPFLLSCLSTLPVAEVNFYGHSTESVYSFFPTCLLFATKAPLL